MVRNSAWRRGLIFPCAVACVPGGHVDDTPVCNNDSEAYERINAAVKDADLSCQIDSDCTYMQLYSSCCLYRCGYPKVIVSTHGVSGLKGALDEINRTDCSAGIFATDCFCPSPPCLAVGDPLPPPSPICVNGLCQTLPSDTWSTINLLRNEGDLDGVLHAPDTIPSCGSSTRCAGWYLASMNSLTIMDAAPDAGGRSYLVSSLSASDYAAVDRILRSDAFRTMELGLMACDPAPSGAFLELAIQRDTIKTFDVTGCVLSGPADNAPRQLFNIITSY